MSMRREHAKLTTSVCQLVRFAWSERSVLRTTEGHSELPYANLSTKTEIFTEEKLRIALHVCGSRMALNGPEVTRNFDLAFRTDVLEILISEDNQLPFCDEQRKLIQPFLSKLRDLHPFEFCPYIRAEVLLCDVVRE